MGKYIYRTNFLNEIKRFKLVKETEKQAVFINDNGREVREAKRQHYSALHKTFQDAKNYLIEKQTKKINDLSSALERESERLEQIKQIQEF